MNTPSFSEIQKLNDQLNQASFSHWIHDDLFAFTWWFLLISAILPYLLWWKISDKTRFIELTAFGLFSAVLASFLDLLGVTMGLWGYPDKLISSLPPLLPADLSVIPVFSMIIYQFSKTWFSYVLKYVLFAAILSFVIEPIFVKFEMYAHYKWWTHTCSFIGILLFGIVIRLFISFVLRHSHT